MTRTIISAMVEMVSMITRNVLTAELAGLEMEFMDMVQARGVHKAYKRDTLLCKSRRSRSSIF